MHFSHTVTTAFVTSVVVSLVVVGLFSHQMLGKTLSGKVTFQS